MKNVIFTLLILIGICLNSNAQKVNCSNYNDCLSKARNSNFNTQKDQYFELALKYAKKEKINPSVVYVERAAAQINYWTNKKEIKEAEKNLKAAMKADPTNYLAHSWMAYYIRERQKNNTGAADYLTKISKDFPNNPELLFDRGLVHYYGKRYDQANIDLSMALNLSKGNNEISAYRKGEISRFLAFSELNKKNIKVRDAETLRILKEGLDAGAGQNEKYLGELALAYYDNDDLNNARKYANEALKLGESNLGRFIIGLEAFEKSQNDYWRDKNANQLKSGQKYFYKPTSDFGYAVGSSAVSHPLILYYAAYSAWHYYSIDAPNNWASQVGLIRDRFNGAIRDGAGTKYQKYADEAANHLNTLR